MTSAAQQVVLASGNAGKLRELQAALADSGLELIPQSQFSITEAVEDASTFLENALIKARHAAKQTGLAALADDSGLVVPALNGAPGIHSARYSGGGDNANNDKLLTELTDITGSSRQAWYMCVLVYVSHESDPAPKVAEGRWYGEIALAPRGSGGFGYDPIFWLPELNCSAAELDAATKQRLGHRGKAVAKLREQFEL